eukprot:gene23879-biopygen17870
MRRKERRPNADGTRRVPDADRTRTGRGPDAVWEKQLRPRPVRVRSFECYRAPRVRFASGPRPLPFFPGRGQRRFQDHENAFIFGGKQKRWQPRRGIRRKRKGGAQKGGHKKLLLQRFQRNREHCGDIVKGAINLKIELRCTTLPTLTPQHIASSTAFPSHSVPWIACVVFISLATAVYLGVLLACAAPAAPHSCACFICGACGAALVSFFFRWCLRRRFSVHFLFPSGARGAALSHAHPDPACVAPPKKSKKKHPCVSPSSAQLRAVRGQQLEPAAALVAAAAGGGRAAAAQTYGGKAPPGLCRGSAGALPWLRRCSGHPAAGSECAPPPRCAPLRRASRRPCARRRRGRRRRRRAAGGTGHWRGRGAGCKPFFWLWVARAWRGRGADMSCSPNRGRGIFADCGMCRVWRGDDAGRNGSKKNQDFAQIRSIPMTVYAASAGQHRAASQRDKRQRVRAGYMAERGTTHLENACMPQVRGRSVAPSSQSAARARCIPIRTISGPGPGPGLTL